MGIIASSSVPPESRLHEADTRNLTAISRPADIRFPVNPVYTGRAAVAVEQDLAAKARALFEGNATAAEMAAQLGVTETEAVDLVLDDIARETGWTRGVGLRAKPGGGGNPDLCPSWCTKTHTDLTDEELLHSSTATSISIEDGTHLRETVTIVVQLDAFESPALPGGIDPTSVYLSASCDQNPDTWLSGNMSPAQAEQIGQALLDAARTARQASA
ncbi:hypothetical protein AB0I89_32175 [Micromonospora sp. NPDC049801]|uniref:DUF6907 domain-containing protein n=1 Tax=unclassified Micromonospora TaxID=2617518 RepID=UPI00341101A1